MNTKIGFSSLVIASMIFSTYGVFSRILSHELSVFQQLSYRYLMGFGLVLVIMLISRQKIRIRKFVNRHVFLFALFIPISFYFFIRSFLESKLSVSISGFYAGTIISSLAIGTLILREKLDVGGVVGLILLMISFLFLNNFELQIITSIGLVWGLVSGLAYGSANYLKKVSGKYTKEEMLLVMTFSVTLIMQSFSLFAGEPMVVNLQSVTIVVLVLFTLTALGAEYLTLVGFRNFNLYLGSIVLSLEIVFTLIVGAVFFDEWPTEMEAVGIIMVMLAVVATNLPNYKEMKVKYGKK